MSLINHEDDNTMLMNRKDEMLHACMHGNYIRNDE